MKSLDGAHLQLGRVAGNEKREGSEQSQPNRKMTMNKVALLLIRAGISVVYLTQLELPVGVVRRGRMPRRRAPRAAASESCAAEPRGLCGHPDAGSMARLSERRRGLGGDECPCFDPSPGTRPESRACCHSMSAYHRALGS